VQILIEKEKHKKDKKEIEKDGEKMDLPGILRTVLDIFSVNTKQPCNTSFTVFIIFSLCSLIVKTTGQHIRIITS